MTPTNGPGHFIYITGCDGVGKTTHAALIAARLRQQGMRVTHVWLRFPFLFSIPLLAYARWRRFSWREEHDGVNHGYWHFSSSRLLRRLLPWTLLVDAALFGLFKIHLPLWLGKTVVCERYALDMLVDLGLAFDDPNFAAHFPGRLYLRLIPSQAQIIIIDLDAATIRARRPDLNGDHALDMKLERYRSLCRDYDLPCLSNGPSLAQVSASIHQMIMQGGPS